MNNRFLNTLKIGKTNNRTKRWPMQALEAFLLIVSGWRTWDFIVLIMAGLPGVVFYVVLTVVISEGAYLVWSKVAYPEADDGRQETTAIFLIVLNTIGLLLLSFGENLMRATSGASWAGIMAEALKFTPWAMLGLNLVGALLYNVLDDDHIDAKTRRSQARADQNAERDLKHAENMAHITAKIHAIELLQKESDGLARELAPIYLKDITNRVKGQTMKNLKAQGTRIENKLIAEENKINPAHQPGRDHLRIPVKKDNGTGTTFRTKIGVGDPNFKNQGGK